MRGFMVDVAGALLLVTAQHFQGSLQVLSLPREWSPGS
jgi:hypothetical protein